MTGFLLACLLAAIVSSSADPQCDVRGAVVSCDNKHLTNFPVIPVVQNCSTIDLSYNEIKTIPERAFYNTSNTTELHIYLDHNLISHVNDSAFAGLENVVVHLYIQNNMLTQSIPTALMSLTRLTHLHLDGVQNLEKNTLLQLGKSLTHLGISLKNIATWPSQLQVLTNLKTLKLSQISFGSFPQDAFVGFGESLEVLEIKETAFSSPFTAICQLNNLQVLTLDNCNIGDMSKFLPTCNSTIDSVWRVVYRFTDFSISPDMFSLFPRLTHLEIFNNSHLHIIPEDLIPAENNVSHVVVFGSPLSQIPYAVQRMKKLQTLELSSTRIETIESNDIGDLPDLKRLVLAYNPLKDIGEHAFEQLPSLSLLNLNNNQLKEPALSKRIGGIHYASNLDLSNNPINCSCGLNWTKKLTGRLFGTCHDPATDYEKKIEQFVTTCP